MTYEALPREVKQASDQLASNDELRVRLKNQLNLHRPYFFLSAVGNLAKIWSASSKPWEPLPKIFP